MIEHFILIRGSSKSFQYYLSHDRNFSLLVIDEDVRKLGKIFEIHYDKENISGKVKYKHIYFWKSKILR